jgi:hypothetical protein
MGRSGYTPYVFSKSAEVDWNQGVVEYAENGSVQAVERKGFAGGRKNLSAGAVRRGKVSSRTRIAWRGVLVNDDLVSGNSNG